MIMPGGLGGSGRYRSGGSAAKPKIVKPSERGATRHDYALVKSKPGSPNPYQRAPGAYRTTGVMGSAQSGASNYALGDIGRPVSGPGSPGSGLGGGGGAGIRGGGGGGAGGTVDVKSEESPHLAEAIERYKAQAAKIDAARASVDEGLAEQVELYRKRMGEGPTTRAIERAGSSIRDFAAGQAEEAKRMGAMGGRGAGFGAAGLGESAQRAQAGAAADISLGRERDLDRLLVAGQNIMAAPGARDERLLGMGSQFYSQNPYGEQANYMLGSQGLGLEALRLENQMNPQMNPYQMYQMLFPQGVF